MTARTPSGVSRYRDALDARDAQRQWDDAVEVKRLRAEVSALKAQLRYEVGRVERWRLRYGALQARLREMERG